MLEWLDINVSLLTNTLHTFYHIQKLTFRRKQGRQSLCSEIRQNFLTYITGVIKENNELDFTNTKNSVLITFSLFFRTLCMYTMVYNHNHPPFSSFHSAQCISLPTSCPPPPPLPLPRPLLPPSSKFNWYHHYMHGYRVILWSTGNLPVGTLSDWFFLPQHLSTAPRYQ